MNKKGKLKTYYKNGQLGIDGEVELLNGEVKVKKFNEEAILFLLVDLLNGQLNVQAKTKIYYENSKLGFDGELSNGTKLKVKIYNEKGQLQFEIEAELLNGQIKVKEYKKDDILKSIIIFLVELLNGKINGKINEKVYYENNKIEFEGEYLNGEVKVKNYFENGDLKNENKLLNGQGKELDEKFALEFIHIVIGQSYESKVFFFVKELLSGTGKEFIKKDIIGFALELLIIARNN